MRKLLWVLPLLSLMGAECTGTSGNCSVSKDEATGVATIRCPDGSSVEVGPGPAGKDGAAGTNGTDGAAGASGRDGAPGEDGTSCTVTKDPDAGVTTIACGDGTTATVVDGAEGAKGDTGAKGDKGDTGEKGDTGDAGIPGTPGPVSLVKLDEESTGTNCPAGGVKVSSGVDTSGNGVLEPGEVTQERYLCAPGAPDAGIPPCTTLEGNYTVANTLDWQLLAQSGCTALPGTLTITAPAVTALVPAAPLTSVGNLVVKDNAQLTGFGASLPHLQQVTTEVKVINNAALTTVLMPALTTVGVRMEVTTNAALTTISLPELATVGGTTVSSQFQFTVQSNPALTSLLVPKLSSANVFVWRNALLAGVSLPELTTGLLSLYQNPQLAGFAAPKVTTLRTLSVEYNPVLTEVSLPALTHTTLYTTIQGNDLLQSIRLPSLVTVPTHLEFRWNDNLSELELPELTTVVGNVDLFLNPLLATFSAPKVQSVNGQPSVGCQGFYPYHDDGRGLGVCVRAGACAAGYRDNGVGQCVTGSCASGFHDVYGRCTADMATISGGSSTSGDWGYAGGAVSVAPFQMDKTEVTVAQYNACLAAGQCTPPDRLGNWGAGGRERHPVDAVTWHQATAFCAWAGKRLPTEVEWQWAASNGDTTYFPWGGAFLGDISPNDTHARWSGITPKYQTAEVGTHPAGATFDGLQDMAGNVMEWTSSAFSPGSALRAIRGGNVSSPSASYLGREYRDAVTPDLQGPTYGFRCAR